MEMIWILGNSTKLTFREDESDEEKRRNPFYDNDEYGESQNIYEEAGVIKLPLSRG